MKTVDQTIVGENGNCMAACIASLLEIEIDEIPNLSEEGWLSRLNEWLGNFGLFYMELSLPQTYWSGMKYWGYHTICGKSPRGLLHAVVGLQGKMVHDPHPEKSGLIVGKLEYGFIIRGDAKLADRYRLRVKAKIQKGKEP